MGRLKARLRDEPSLYVPPLILRHAYRRGVEGQLERSRTRRWPASSSRALLRFARGSYGAPSSRALLPAPAAALATLSRSAKRSPSGAHSGAALEGPATPRPAAVASGRGAARVPALAAPTSPMSAAEAFLRRLHLRDAPFSPSRRSGSLETTPGAALRAGAFLAQPGPRSLLRPATGILFGAAPLGDADVAPPQGNVRLTGLSCVARTRDPFDRARLPTRAHAPSRRLLLALRAHQAPEQSLLRLGSPRSRPAGA